MSRFASEKHFTSWLGRYLGHCGVALGCLIHYAGNSFTIGDRTHSIESNAVPLPYQPEPTP